MSKDGLPPLFNAYISPNLQPFVPWMQRAVVSYVRVQSSLLSAKLLILFQRISLAGVRPYGCHNSVIRNLVFR